MSTKQTSIDATEVQEVELYVDAADQFVEAKVDIPHIDLDTSIVLGGGGGDTGDHSQLINRNLANQHPINAITGLRNELDSKQTELPESLKGQYLHTNEITGEIEWLDRHGHYLGFWDCVAGTPSTSLPSDPFIYKAGDYFGVTNISSTQNYGPSGTYYNSASSSSRTVWTNQINGGDFFYFNGGNWRLISFINNVYVFDDHIHKPTGDAVGARLQEGKICIYTCNWVLPQRGVYICNGAEQVGSTYVYFFIKHTRDHIYYFGVKANNISGDWDYQGMTETIVKQSDLNTKQNVLISSGATVGQFAQVSAVDANGKPTAWIPVDVSSGGEPAAYIKAAAVSQDGNTLTLTKKDNSTVEFSPDSGGLSVINKSMSN